MKTEISSKQKEILNFIENYITKNKFPPSIREICKNVNLSSPASVHAHLKHLEELNLIKHTTNKFRSIEIIKKNIKTNKIPIIDNFDVTSLKNITKYLNLPFINDLKECYAIKCLEDIFEFKKGDYLIIEKQKNYKKNDIIIYIINEKLILNRYDDVKKYDKIIGKVVCSINHIF